MHRAPEPVGSSPDERALPGSDFTYRACSCQAMRTFRLHRPPPLSVEFFTIHHSLEFHAPAADSESIRA